MAPTTAADKEKTDHWSSEAYFKYASFVPKLTKTVLQYLDPKPTDRVLDVGCGDGKFTANFLPAVAFVLGIDASPSMIESAKTDYGCAKAEFRVVDCRYLNSEADIVNGSWDKVISNAALHWILRDETTRLQTLQAIHKSLKPNGTFVFEMGGHGNVPEVHTALLSALIHQGGKSLEEARKASPWFFPSEARMRAMLESVGFRVEKLEIEYRPTKLTDDENGGIHGWVRLMGASMLHSLEDERQEAAVKEVCDLLETIITREEDGSKWLGYVRLRGIAIKA
ncbi:hypothetical protein VTO42DRAFT_3835 [Malbranchea cinnamomea]